MFSLTILKCCYRTSSINIIRKYCCVGSCSITIQNCANYGYPITLDSDKTNNRFSFNHRKNIGAFYSIITTNQFRYLNGFYYRKYCSKSEINESTKTKPRESPNFTSTKTVIGTENLTENDQKKLNVDLLLNEGTEKLGLFARFKLMYKKYWYVLIPVHVITSIGWLGGFYYMSKSGVDIASILEYLHISDAVMDKIKQSNMGHYAVAYLCYKIATPLRYAVTLGGTTVSIKYLVQHGYIRPVPTKKELIRMYEDNKAIRAIRKEKKD